MKLLPFIILFLLCCPATAQVRKLAELSSGKFLDSAVIKEEDESDVFGYCLLYESNRKSKEVYDLEYIILDKNLNKLTTVHITQGVFKTWMANTRAELTFVKKIGNTLIISVNDRLSNINGHELMQFFNYRFINLNLTDFSFSKEYKFEGFVKKEFEYKPGDKIEINDFWNLQKLLKTNSNKILSFATPEYNPKAAAISNMLNFDFKRQKSVKSFAILDTELNVVWNKAINTNEKEAYAYEYLDSDGDILLLQKEILVKKEYYELAGIEAYDINTGKMLGEIKLEDAVYNMNLHSITISDGKIHIFTNAYDKKGKSHGYGQLVYDKKSATELSRKFILWKNLTTAIPEVNEFGVLPKNTWLFAQDFILTPKGNTLMVAEAYTTRFPASFGNNPKAYADLKDLYLIEFNTDGSIAYSKTIEKKNSVQIPGGMGSMNLRKYGAFDYIFSQKINKKGDFVFYYTLNDQEGNAKMLIKKPLWTLGIVSYVDGQYGYEELPLYGENLKIYPGLAKNGYIRLLEVNQKTNEAELRLEKINY